MPRISHTTRRGRSLRKGSRASALDAGAARARIDISKALRESEERLHVAIEAGSVGAWDWDIVHDRLVWSDQVYEFFGVPRDQFDGRFASFARLVHPDDQERVGELIQQ